MPTAQLRAARLDRLITQLDEDGVSIAWARELPVPGIFVAAFSLLVLSASAGQAEVIDACRDVLRLVDLRLAR